MIFSIFRAIIVGDKKIRKVVIMKRILGILSMILVLAIMLSGCNGSKAPTPTEETSKDLELITNGTANATLIYPSGNSDLRDTCRNIVKEIKTGFGISMNFSSDSSTAADSESLEILVGNTNRPESSEALKKLTKVDDYVCERSGNKLVLAGVTQAATQKAVQYFISKFIDEPKGTDLIFTPEDDFVLYVDYAVSLDSCAGNPLVDYRIVYPAGSTNGEYYVALSMRYHLYTSAGIDIEVVDDSTAANGKEILIGQTNRGKTPAPVGGEFSVTVKDGNLCISANDLFGYIDAEKYLTSSLFSHGVDDNILTEGFTYSAKAETAPERAGNYRVIFNNVWGLDKFANRDEYAVAYYLAYQPDIVCLNEYWDPLRKEKVIAETLIENGYVEVIPEAKTEIKGNNGNPANNVLPVFYDPTVLKVVDSAYVHYTWYRDDTTEDSSARADDSKGITFVVFEGLDAEGNGNGERFIILNTHLTSNYISKLHGYNSRLLNIDTLWDELQPFLEKYPDASVIAGCDFNSNIDSDECKKLLSLGFKPCHDTADTADDQCSHHGYPTYNEIFGYFTSPAGYSKANTYAKSIDHIFEYGDTVDAKLFDTLLNDYTALFTDHSPLLLDFNVITNEQN